MQEAKGSMQERPNLPKRLESIEDKVRSLHEIADRMRSVDEKTEAPPTCAGIEEAAVRVEESMQRLIHRFAAIADTVGQL